VDSPVQVAVTLVRSGMAPYSPDPGCGHVLNENEAFDFDDAFEREEELLNSRFVANSCRGLANGYARSECERSRALVVGCNYPRNRSSRLWGACADARDWATTLTKRLGVPERNVALLLDEADDGKPANAGSRDFPSQRNIYDHLVWLTNDVQPGDLLVFVFCGRGTLLLDDAGLDPETGDDAGDGSDNDGDPVEEALLCGDFDTADWMSGYSKRVVTATSLARYWEDLPGGTSLTLVIDAEHGTSMLPVTRRLDSTRIPPGVNLNDEPTPMLEPMVFGSGQSRAAVAQALRLEARRPGVLDPRHGGRRDSGGAWPKKSWLRGQLLWDALVGGDEAPAPLEAEVQAFAFTASGPVSVALEVDVGRGKRQRGPSARRGLLTHCLLHALEELNFQGTYYALWWCAMRRLGQLGVAGQHFQLLFADGADPTCREAFEVIGAAEARAYARRAELQQQVVEGGECTDEAWTSNRCCSSVKDDRCHREDKFDMSFVMDEAHS